MAKTITDPEMLAYRANAEADPARGKERYGARVAPRLAGPSVSHMLP